MKTNTKKIISVMLSFVLLLSCSAFALAEGGTADKQYKNVILFIGDGMGINSINAAKWSGYDTPALDSMPVRGWSKTASATSPVTDSAAGGTALACGVRTYNGGIGTFVLDPFSLFMVPASLTEAAAQEGMSTGVVTTDSTSGATPASFSAHAYDRDDEDDISNDQLTSGINLIWGAASESVNRENCAANGYTYISTRAEMYALEAGTNSFAQFSSGDFSNLTNNNDTPTIAEMTGKAIQLLNADEDGFFLMVEGAHIDKKSHNKDMAGMTAQLNAFDEAVAIALAFAKLDGETVVVVTADHETGGIKHNEKTGEYYYTSGSHTGVDVPLLVNVEDTAFENGEAIKNAQVARNLAEIIDTDGQMTLPYYNSPFIEYIKKLFG